MASFNSSGEKVLLLFHPVMFVLVIHRFCLTKCQVNLINSGYLVPIGDSNSVTIYNQLTPDSQRFLGVCAKPVPLPGRRRHFDSNRAFVQ